MPVGIGRAQRVNDVSDADLEKTTSMMLAAHLQLDPGQLEHVWTDVARLGEQITDLQLVTAHVMAIRDARRRWASPQ